MGKLKYCYHSHTKRCGHACGEDEEYVIKAIQLGIKRLGFSDHVFLPKGYEQPGTRGNFDRLDDYLNSIKSLKEKYKNQIDIIVGFEAEYSDAFVDYYKYLLKHYENDIYGKDPPRAGTRDRRSRRSLSARRPTSDRT